MVYARLGNNLFQIANGMTFASRSGKTLHLVLKESSYDPKLKYPSFFDRLSLERISITSIPNSCTIRENNAQNYVDFEYVVSENVVLDGYFQSERYIDVDLVRNAFRMTEDTRSRLLAKYSGISDGVGMSVRRGDYLGLRETFNVLSSAYYNDIYHTYFNGLKCFVSSDDISWCRQNLKIKDCVFLDERDDIVMRALSLCKHHILSCSTFSWWSAWLEEKTDSLNIVTDKWFVAGCGICDDEKVPSRWKRVELLKEYLF